jgi:glycosyltransferase involved in cell wall biosynthesis
MSVVIPTRDRPERLEPTLQLLSLQEGVDPGEYEVIVVDDGSKSPATAEMPAAGPAARVVRLEGEGPSAARNKGASVARGELLVFVDDDMQVVPGFLASHWRAHQDWPAALQVGFNRLSEAETARSFGRFRQRLEDESMPNGTGPVQAPNFCTAANMAIDYQLFERLGGFDPALSTGEDQDLAMRHTERGGNIVFVAAARAVHNDSAVGLGGYLDRAERYMEELVRFGARHPEWPDTVERERVNGPVSWRREPLPLTAKKLVKTALMWRPIYSLTLRLISVVETIAPDGRLLDKLYRILLGAHLQRGYRRGLRAADG